jgi:hypothetical protein
MKNETTLNNSLREQKGLEILDIDNLKEFTTLCNKLPLDFKSQYIFSQFSIFFYLRNINRQSCVITSISIII